MFIEILEILIVGRDFIESQKKLNNPNTTESLGKVNR